MAMVLQASCVPSSTSNTTSMDSGNQLHHSSNQDDSFQRKIFEKIEEGKHDRDPEKCQQILDDLMKMLKYLTADVNKYNSTFRETRPPFYLQEFQRLTDRIDTLTRARDTLTEYLHELQGQHVETTLPRSSSPSDVTSIDPHFPQQSPYSPATSHSAHSSVPENADYQHTSSSSSIHSNLKDFESSTVNEHGPSSSMHSTQRPRSPSMTPNNFIRIHFPNKHTTALAPRSDETLEVALESRASRHSVTDLRAYIPVYMISRQPCPWDITLDRLRETEIELEEKPKLDHSFETIPTSRFPVFIGVRCVVCQHRIREAHKRCVSCGNNYHNRCSIKAPVCSHSILQHIKHLGPERFDLDRVSAQARAKEQSRSLPRIPITRPSINTKLGVAVNGSTLTSPETLRPSVIRPKYDISIDTKKPAQKYVSEWELPPDDLINHGRMVGRGTYGTVYKAEIRLHGHVALKELNFVSPTPTQFQAFRNEVYALKKIRHQNTLNFYGYMNSPRFAIVTQWCEGSTLYKHIHILDRHWKINQLIDIARQICQGMSYLHDREIIHRDLKSSNVFLDMSTEPDDAGVCWRVKIGDFGLAAVKTVLAEGDNQQFQPTGSVLWMAPEVIQQKDPNCYSTSSDVYAYGCVLFEMFSEKLPHSPMSNKEQIMWLVGKGKLKIKVEQCRDDTPGSILELIRQSTAFEREQRPNFAPEIDDTLSKFEFIFPRIQRSQSEPCLIRSPHDDLLGLSINFGVPKTPVSNHRRLNAEAS